MDFGSIRRKNRVSQPSRRKTFSASNLSYISCNSAAVGRKTIYVTLPKDFGCEVNLDGKIVHMRHDGPAYATGALQLGDYLRIVDEDDDETIGDGSNEQFVKLQVTFGVLQVDSRLDCPLVIEIGNRSHTSLGIALADNSENKIQITSIQAGSLADRCGFLQTGDILTSIYISETETIPCSPFYNSYQIAQILRQLTTKNSTIKLTIIPCSEKNLNSSPQFLLNSSAEEIDVHSGGSDSTLTLGDSDSLGGSSSKFLSGFHGTSLKTSLSAHSKLGSHKRQISKVDELEEENGYVLSLCLWKDPLYEDWGFSLVDQSETETEGEIEKDSVRDVNNVVGKSGKLGLSKPVGVRGAIVYQIRPGGPASLAGLRSSDRIVEINGRDVSQLESTMLVPILASLDEALNIMILRIPNSSANE